MIIYFSATGNCKYIAKRIAEEMNDSYVSITEIKDKIILKDGEQLGIITPTYFWRLPSIVDEFFENVIIENGKNSYIYYIATYGTTSGQTDYYVKKHLKKKGLKLSASFNIKTVDNWTVLFSVNDKEKIDLTLKEELKQVYVIVHDIKEKKKIFINKDKKSLFLCGGAKHFYRKARKTKHLHVNNDCIGCGLCEKICPTKAIKIVDNKPDWILNECTMCFGCLHNCPKFAIQYDDKTQNNGQYKHPE